MPLGCLDTFLQVQCVGLGGKVGNGDSMKKNHTPQTGLLEWTFRKADRSVGEKGCYGGMCLRVYVYKVCGHVVYYQHTCALVWKMCVYAYR